MLRAVIVDDEQLAIDLLRILLEDTGKVNIVGACCKPTEAIEKIAALEPDVVFLDVEMPGINGIELAVKILDRSEDTDIVFVTAFRDYAVEAIELNAVDYLIKPVLPEKLERAVFRLLKRRQQRRISTGTNNAMHIRGLGAFETRTSANGETVKWRTAKVEELFAYLLYHRGTTVRKEEIIDSLWSGSEPKNADNTLHTSVYKLKKILKDTGGDVSVKFSGGGYILDVGPDVDYDVARFEAFDFDGKEDIAEVETIAALYQGDYLEGKDYLWCMAERARLQKHFSDVAKQVARYYIHSSHFSKAEQMLLRNIRYLPYDEDAYELLMKVCYGQKDRPAMIKYYEVVQGLLRHDLGIEPRPSLRRLYESLMNDFCTD